MKLLYTVPICANTLFIYKLNLTKDLSLEFEKEKFKSFDRGSAFMGEDLNILKKYEDLNTEINNALDSTIKDVLKLNNVNYRIYNSWLTKAKPESFSDSHNHSNSWLSGVYYPKGNAGFNIKFFNDNISQFYTPPTEYNIFNSGEWTINIEDNFLIIFFSQLRHKMMQNKSNIDRYSLAFNVVPKGKFGDADSTIIF
tara:strand:- start:342 stop:932 length:591 start_codon:yes stop_codon:yes gene_type:complete